ncbi:MAG: TIM barrel protein [Clostridia bacterium]|nr:TIM barrel protein [Clostridia bacterium]
MKTRFGSAGNPESFYEAGFKSSVQMPEYLAGQGLNAYEYQCSRGVRISEKLAREIGAKAKEFDIAMSIHAPYYINLSSEDTKIQDSSKVHLMKSLEVARWMGATRIVFHAGGGAKGDRVAALSRAKKLLLEVLEEKEAGGYEEIYLCPETMGKLNQLGNMEEVLELCKLHPKVIPTIDFGHLHAASQGSLTNKEAFGRILDRVGEVLGEEVMKNLHVHFSPIEFTGAGEKKHWTLLDAQFGPDFVHLAQLMAERHMTPVIICESAGRQSEDAKIFRNMYELEIESRN